MKDTACGNALMALMEHCKKQLERHIASSHDQTSAEQPRPALLNGSRAHGREEEAGMRLVAQLPSLLALSLALDKRLRIALTGIDQQRGLRYIETSSCLSACLSVCLSTCLRACVRVCVCVCVCACSERCTFSGSCSTSCW